MVMSAARDMTTPEERCRALSERVERLCAVVLVCQLGVLPLLPQADSSVIVLAVLLALAWVFWIVLQKANYSLIRCGPQTARYDVSARWINRPEFLVRLGFHLLINWSVIATTLVVAWQFDEPLSRNLAWVAAIFTVSVWVGFNLLHRRMNRAKNLALTTAIALLLLSVAWPLLGAP